MAYLGHLVRMVVPMQGHAEGVASAVGTLTTTPGCPSPEDFSVPIELIYDDADLVGTGIYLWEGGPLGDEVMAYSAVTIRVHAVDINNPNLIVARGQTDFKIQLDGAAQLQTLDPTGDGTVIAYEVTSFGGSEFSIGIQWRKRRYFLNTLQYIEFYDAWTIDPGQADLTSATFLNLGTGAESWTDQITATNNCGHEELKTANRIITVSGVLSCNYRFWPLI